MKSNSKIVVLLTGIAVSATAVASAYADDGPRGMMRRGGDGHYYGQNMRGMGPGMGPRGEGPAILFQRADKDNSGTVTLEEFAAMSPLSFTDADANGDGNINADELAAQIERNMLRRRAERMIERFDADNDGQVSLSEIENHQKQMFARIDIDGSGAIEKDELRGGNRGQRGEGHGFMHQRGGYGRN